MKYTKKDIFDIWDKKATVIEVEEEFRRYIVLLENDNEKRYVSDEQIELSNKEYVTENRTGRVMKRYCCYGINPLYNNLPALGGYDYRGEFDRIDYIHLREATPEEINIYKDERDKHKWEAIDREYGELMIGDIILKDNKLIEIVEQNIDIYNFTKDTQLVCAVGYRFDKNEYAF